LCLLFRPRVSVVALLAAVARGPLSVVLAEADASDGVTHTQRCVAMVVAVAAAAATWSRCVAVTPRSVQHTQH
jgi:hypothetical protein